MQAGTRVRLSSVSGKWLDELPQDERRDLLFMVAEIFEIDAVGEHGHPWFASRGPTKRWERATRVQLRVSHTKWSSSVSQCSNISVERTLERIEGKVRMLGKITYELAEASDADELASLRVEAMRESLQRVGRFDPQRSRERFLSAFSPGHTHHILLDGQKVGFYVVKPETNGLLLDHLYIRPGYQGQGLGASTLAEVFSQADQEGLSLRVGALRESDSNHFYARHGFALVEQAEFDNYYVRRATNAL